jgi:hypothetical protein
MMSEGMYPKCGRCGIGILVPVNLGETNRKSVVYRCTNIKCNAKLDEHGYSIFDTQTLTWERITEG